MENKYFENKEFNSETIKEAYEEAKKEELIKTSYDEMNFKDYVVKHSTYSKEEVDVLSMPCHWKKRQIQSFSFRSI